VANRLFSPQVFRSPTVQSNARTIVGLSQNRIASAGVSLAPRRSDVAPSTSRSRPQGQIRPNQGQLNGERVSQPRSTSELPRVSEGRVFSPPFVRGRSINPASPRVFSAPATGGRGSFGGFSGGGGISRHGGSFRGGSRGHG
jgi:hypothetical protein